MFAICEVSSLPWVSTELSKSFRRSSRLSISQRLQRLSRRKRTTLHRRQRRKRPTILARHSLGLALRGIATSAIDISDGFLGDLSHILRQSRVGARIDTSSAKKLMAARGIGDELRLEYVLAGGDDYELAFTAPASQREAVQAAAQNCGTPVTRIGNIEAQAGLRLIAPDGSLMTRSYNSFDHFK